MFKKLLMTLYLTSGLGNQLIYKIMEKARILGKDTLSLEEVFQLGEIHQSFQQKKIANSYLKWTQASSMIEKYLEIPFICYWDLEYPEKLRQMYQFPVILFYKGNLDLLNQPSLGVVGTRGDIFKRREILEKLLLPIIDDYVIVSGLAKGTDTSSHELALNNHGKTIGVIGTGLEVAYPKENSHLQSQISKRGLLLSEYLPHIGPKRHHFPLRNRIIAGLSEGVLVLGAKEKSGSLITADWALDHNREVFAVPGPIYDENYRGSLKLIQQGAKCVYEGKDIVEELKFERYLS